MLYTALDRDSPQPLRDGQPTRRGPSFFQQMGAGSPSQRLRELVRSGGRSHALGAGGDGPRHRAQVASRDLDRDRGRRQDRGSQAEAHPHRAGWSGEPDGEGFETRQISSAVAYLHKPAPAHPRRGLGDGAAALRPAGRRHLTRFKNRRTEQIHPDQRDREVPVGADGWPRPRSRRSRPFVPPQLRLLRFSRIIPTPDRQAAAGRPADDAAGLAPARGAGAQTGATRRPGRWRGTPPHALERPDRDEPALLHQFFERMYRYGGFLLFTRRGPSPRFVLMVALGNPQRDQDLAQNLSEVTRRGLASHPHRRHPCSLKLVFLAQP